MLKVCKKLKGFKKNTDQAEVRVQLQTVETNVEPIQTVETIVEPKIKKKRNQVNWVLLERSFSSFDSAVSILTQENWKMFKMQANRCYFKCIQNYHCKSRKFLEIGLLYLKRLFEFEGGFFF